VIDRLREQIQERLEQLAGEADRLRKALAALDPRSSNASARKQPARKPAQPTKPATSATKRIPARRTSQPAARSPRRTTPGATKASVLAALARGDDRRRGGGQGRPCPGDSVDDSVEAREERRGGESRAWLPAALGRHDFALLAGRVAGRLSVLFTPRRRRYRGRVLPLGFRFDVDAVIVEGVAHRADCDRVPTGLPNEAVSVPAAGGLPRRGVPA
jgi:hypothetical protein